MSITLRPYQQQIISEVARLVAKKEKKILICSPTGSGKTALSVKMISDAIKSGKRAMFIVHRKELVEQTRDAFLNQNIECGLITSDTEINNTNPIQLALVQTLVRRLDKVEPPDVIIWDECHHCISNTYKKIHKYYESAYHIGLTATPQRLDGKGLGGVFDHIVLGPSTRSLIEANYLSDYKYYSAPVEVDLSNIKTTKGDYDKPSLEREMTKSFILGHAATEYIKHSNGKRAIVFCVSINHSISVMNDFISRGISCAQLDGKTNKKDRLEIINKFKSGEVLVLCNVDLFGEGFDLPAIETVIMLRPTQSLSIFLQQVGRGLRIFPEKDHAIILDHSGNYKRHGLPDDFRMWSLFTRKKTAKQKETEQIAKIKSCKDCLAVIPAHCAICEYCGAAITSSANNREVKEMSGELVAVKRTAKQYNKEMSQLVTREDFVEYAKERGYSMGWVYIRWKLRQKNR